MTEQDRKEALAWLDDWATSRSAAAAQSARTLKAMLAEPRMPEEPSEELIRVMRDGGQLGETYELVSNAMMRHAYRALHAHLSKLATKEVDVWRIEYASCPDGPVTDTCQTAAEAHEQAEYLRKCGQLCIRVTGPHKQTVPA